MKGRAATLVAVWMLSAATGCNPTAEWRAREQAREESFSKVRRIAVCPVRIELAPKYMVHVGAGRFDEVRYAYEDEICLTLSQGGFEVIGPSLVGPIVRKAFDRMNQAKSLDGRPLERSGARLQAAFQQIAEFVGSEMGADGLLVAVIDRDTAVMKDRVATWAGRSENAERLTLGNVIADTLTSAPNEQTLDAVTLRVTLFKADRDAATLTGRESGIGLLQRREMAELENLKVPSVLMDGERRKRAVAETGIRRAPPAVTPPVTTPQ